jgi:hypothetical protein
MSEDANAGVYVLDAEALAGLRRLVAKLRGDGALSGDERRLVANRMSALLQKAQPQRTSRERQDGAETNQPFGRM